jgi:Rad3-related DNA helicase
LSEFIKNFPFQALREKQTFVLKEIDAAFASGYRYIILEAPTGFGKSAVAIAVALTLGTSYICTSTKDLQTQYARDFPFVKVAKGKNNFICVVKDDFMRNGTYKCGLCASKVEQCYHTTADYGPCLSNESFKIKNKRSGYKYSQDVFKKCNKILMMSAIILDKDAFCTSLGLAPEEVKFIRVASDFPLQNRPIYPLNTAYLNSDSLKHQEVQIKIARAIDNLMTLHRNDKGIIHTTSYKQLDFIKENISQSNRCRLLKTDPKIPRDEAITEHVNNIKPTVLISPSLYIGLDLKDDLSRFQIITKVPYPDLGDRWINEKRKNNGQWYIWQTALRLVQGYGRSIRSKDDWAKTYVLDSGFVNFVKKNSNILPDWFTQAIVVSSEHTAFNSNKVPTTTKENHNPVTNNQHNSSIVSEQQHVNNNRESEIASTAILIKPLDLEISASLDSNDKDERNKLEQRLFICPYCPKLKTTSEIEYQRHIVLKHPGKPGYPNVTVTR